MVCALPLIHDNTVNEWGTRFVVINDRAICLGGTVAVEATLTSSAVAPALAVAFSGQDSWGYFK
jgi:hypothetical protein